MSRLLRDLNDSDDDARRIVELTSGIPCKINLVRFNPHDGAEFFPSSLEVSAEYAATRTTFLPLSSFEPGAKTTVGILPS